MVNDFTKEELDRLLTTIKSLRVYTGIENWDEDIVNKIQYMIDSHVSHDTKCIANSHLQEAASLISHARCLLGFEDE